MPIYEYRCSSCGHELEALQKLSDAPLSTCPSCKADTLVKLVSAAWFQLKGSGWYATDFKGGGTKPAPNKDGGETKSDAKATGEAAGESKADAKSDAKGEAKSETKSEAKTESKGSSTPSSSGTGAPPSST
jgi:putative FmdB family regulatory protein